MGSGSLFTSCSNRGTPTWGTPSASHHNTREGFVWLCQFTPSAVFVHHFSAPQETYQQANTSSEKVRFQKQHPASTKPVKRETLCKAWGKEFCFLLFSLGVCFHACTHGDLSKMS